MQKYNTLIWCAPNCTCSEAQRGHCRATQLLHHASELLKSTSPRLSGVIRRIADRVAAHRITPTTPAPAATLREKILTEVEKTDVRSRLKRHRRFEPVWWPSDN